jgi:predicted glycosyltransferase/nucleoside-diphosphate-sugar epimerase
VNPPRAVITGAAGFIGSHLADSLLAHGRRVVGIDAFTPYYEPAIKRANIAGASRSHDFELLAGDLNELDLEEILQPGDVVFHLAAQPGVRRSWGVDFPDYVRHNIDATQRLLEAARRRGVARVVYASSSSVYGDAPLPMAEDGPLRPISPYGLTKRTAEELCLIYWRTFQLPVVPLRFFTVYGPRQRPDMAFNLFIKAIAEGTPLPVYGDGSQRRDFTFVQDVVAVLMVAAERAEPGVPINVGGGSAVSVRQAISIVEELLERKARLEFHPRATGDAKDTQAQADRVRALGVVPKVSIEEGLELQVAWQVPAMRRVARPASIAPSLRRGSRAQRVLMYSHDGYGLGHFRRNTALAHAMVARNPSVEVVLLSGSPVADDWPLPPRVTLVHLPAAIKTAAETYVPVEARSMSGLRAERAGIISSTLLRMRPDIFLVDHSPLGIKGELALALRMAREELPHTRVVLGLRDIIDDPAVVRATWTEQGVYGVLEESYDQILVYGMRALHDITSLYRFPESTASRTVFTGYVSKDRGVEAAVDGSASWPQPKRGRDRRILVMGGGGADADWLFRGFLKAWKRLEDDLPGEALMVLGPLMEPAVRASIERRAKAASHLTIIDASQKMLSLVDAADLVVSMGGYNSIVEVLAARKPLIVCPRVAPRKEQLIRARLMAGLGLATVVRLEEESSKALAAAIKTGLVSRRQPARDWAAIDLQGAERVAEGLVERGVVTEVGAAA